MDAQDEQEEKQEHASLPVGTAALIAELLAGMSHELRTPLATIKAYTATLLRRERRISRAEQRAFLLAIEQASDHLEVVIDHLLELASLETGMLTLDPECSKSGTATTRGRLGGKASCGSRAGARCSSLALPLRGPGERTW